MFHRRTFRCEDCNWERALEHQGVINKKEQGAPLLAVFEKWD